MTHFQSAQLKQNKTARVLVEHGRAESDQRLASLVLEAELVGVGRSCWARGRWLFAGRRVAEEEGFRRRGGPCPAERSVLTATVPNCQWAVDRIPATICGRPDRGGIDPRCRAAIRTLPLRVGG